MSKHDELRRLSEDFGSGRISRRAFLTGATALGLSGAWIAALERGALAGPAPLRSTLRAGEQVDATTLIVAVEGDIDTFDPAFTVGSKTAQTVIQNTFDQLTQYRIVESTTPSGDPYQTVDTEQIDPMLAESATVEGDTMVFTLPEGLAFSNGDPIDAEVMLTGYQRIFETGGVSSFLMSMGGGVTDASAFAAPDSRTFTITMSRPNTLIPKNNVMHNTSALNPEEVSANTTETDPWATEYFKGNLGIGHGPYQLESYRPGDAITLVANPAYHGAQPAFSTVILKIVPDPIQRVQLLQKGDVDFATLVPIQEYESLTEDSGLKILSIPSNLLTMLEMNSTIPPFDNPAVRQAVAFATPYQEIVDQVYSAQAAPAGSIIPSGMPTSDFTTTPYATDPERARTLLEEAGFPDGDGLPEIKLTVRIGDASWERIAILVQDALREIGMAVTIEKLTYGAFNEAQQAGRLQFWVDEFLSWVNDPFYQMSWTAVSTSPVNYPQFLSERVDELVAEFALAEPGPERDAASVEAQQIINESANYVYLCQPNWTVYTRADIAGYVYYNDELPRFSLFTRE